MSQFVILFSTVSNGCKQFVFWGILLVKLAIFFYDHDKVTCGPFQLPYYIDGRYKITQSNAILRYIARKHDLRKYYLFLIVYYSRSPLSSEIFLSICKLFVKKFGSCIISSVCKIILSEAPWQHDQRLIHVSGCRGF